MNNYFQQFISLYFCKFLYENDWKDNDFFTQLNKMFIASEHHFMKNFKFQVYQGFS